MTIQMIAISVRNLIRDTLERVDDPFTNGKHVERMVGQTENRLDDFVEKVGRNTIDEVQLLPFETQHCSRDRAARHAGNTLQWLQKAKFIQSPERAKVVHHGPITPTGHAQCHPGLRLLSFFGIRYEPDRLKIDCRSCHSRLLSY